MKEIYVTLYKAKWCGYCNRFKPDWEIIKSVFNNNSIKSELIKQNIAISFDEYDDEENKDVIVRAGIKSYPTIRVTIKDINKKTFDIEDNERELTAFTNKILEGTSKELIKMVLNEINMIQNKKNMSGGYFNYVSKPNLKYYGEYLKYKQRYLSLKNK
jgi:hypothetical protein